MYFHFVSRDLAPSHHIRYRLIWFTYLDGIQCQFRRNELIASNLFLLQIAPSQFHNFIIPYTLSSDHILIKCDAIKRIYKQLLFRGSNSDLSCTLQCVFDLNFAFRSSFLFIHFISIFPVGDSYVKHSVSIFQKKFYEEHFYARCATVRSIISFAI